MGDKFEKYIVENRSEFDDLNPPADMWDKITQNDSFNNRSKNLYWTYRISGIAAMLVIAFIAYQQFFLPRNVDNKISGIYQELNEAELYYNAKVNEKKEELFKLTSTSPDIQKDVEKELEQLDSVMLELKTDLKDNIANREVVEALIMNYRMKLQILEEILKYLEPEQNDSDIKNKSNATNI